jgi:hypothetical protein
MDPNATLTRIRQLQAKILDENPESLDNLACELAELVRALDEWLLKGGDFPRDWKPF